MSTEATTLPPAEWINTDARWRACLRLLEQQPRVAVDLEADSLYAYREQVCLLQFSVPGHDFIVDPLAGIALDPLEDLMRNPAIEKVFHASEYDLILLKRQFGWDVFNIFDTMWAARILGYKNMGLAWFLREFYGITLSKKHQKANWAKRPLSPAELAYAQCDTHFLLRLRDELADRLRAAGHYEEALEIFVNESRVRVPERAFDPEAFWSIRGARDLEPRNRAVLRGLYIFRDEVAKRRNQPPFKVLSNETLFALAQRTPRNLSDLARIPGLNPRAAERLGPGLLEVINDGLSGPIPAPPARRRRHDDGVIERYEKLQEWRKRNARERGVESDVILSRDTMWDIANLNPATVEDLARIPTLGPHRLALYHQGILREIQ